MGRGEMGVPFDLVGNPVDLLLLFCFKVGTISHSSACCLCGHDSCVSEFV